jgi:hypothetical protein
MGLDDLLRPDSSLAEERATHLAQELVRHNGTRPVASAEQQLLTTTPQPLQFIPLDAIQAQCGAAA